MSQVGAAADEPYRALLRPLRDMLKRTLMALNQQLAGVAVTHGDILVREAQLWEPLAACYQSMLACGMEVIAERALLDLLRRVRCFGVHLLRHDIRQDEVLATCEVIARQEPTALGAYVISMAKQPSDVLAVHLLLKRAAAKRNSRWHHCSKPWPISTTRAR